MKGSCNLQSPSPQSRGYSLRSRTRFQSSVETPGPLDWAWQGYCRTKHLLEWLGSGSSTCVCVWSHDCHVIGVGLTAGEGVEVL